MSQQYHPHCKTRHPKLTQGNLTQSALMQPTHMHPLSHPHQPQATASVPPLTPAGETSTAQPVQVRGSSSGGAVPRTFFRDTRTVPSTLQQVRQTPSGNKSVSENRDIHMDATMDSGGRISSMSHPSPARQQKHRTTSSEPFPSRSGPAMSMSRPMQAHRSPRADLSLSQPIVADQMTEKKTEDDGQLGHSPDMRGMEATSTSLSPSISYSNEPFQLAASTSPESAPMNFSSPTSPAAAAENDGVTSESQVVAPLNTALVPLHVRTGGMPWPNQTPPSSSLPPPPPQPSSSSSLSTAPLLQLSTARASILAPLIRMLELRFRIQSSNTIRCDLLRPAIPSLKIFVVREDEMLFKGDRQGYAKRVSAFVSNREQDVYVLCVRNDITGNGEHLHCKAEAMIREAGLTRQVSYQCLRSWSECARALTALTRRNRDSVRTCMEKAAELRSEERRVNELESNLVLPDVGLRDEDKYMLLVACGSLLNILRAPASVIQERTMLTAEQVSMLKQIVNNKHRPIATQYQQDGTRREANNQVHMKDDMEQGMLIRNVQAQEMGCAASQAPNGYDGQDNELSSNTASSRFHM